MLDLHEIRQRLAAVGTEPLKAELDVFDHEDPEIEACVMTEGPVVLFTAGTGCRQPPSGADHNQYRIAWGNARTSKAMAYATLFSHAPSDIAGMLAEIERLQAIVDSAPHLRN